MKKDIEWLKEQIEVMETETSENYPHEQMVEREVVLRLINQLGEPETSSVKWIEENKFEFNGWNEAVHVEDLENLIVPKQDLPVVPAWFDEWWKDVSQGEGNLFHNINQFHDKLYSSGTREMYNYINAPDNKKKLLNIIINELDYKVEDEQKYFVSSRESVGFWFLTKDNDGDIAIGTNKDYYDRKWESLKLTEQEIKDYDARYMFFAIPVEENE